MSRSYKCVSHLRKKKGKKILWKSLNRTFYLCQHLIVWWSFVLLCDGARSGLVLFILRSPFCRFISHYRAAQNSFICAWSWFATTKNQTNLKKKRFPQTLHIYTNTVIQTLLYNYKHLHTNTHTYTDAHKHTYKCLKKLSDFPDDSWAYC